MPLSDSAIRSAKPTEKLFGLYDTGGLYLEVSPVGGTLWRLKYRIGEISRSLPLSVGDIDNI